MALPPAFHESLPYIDAPLTPSDLAAANALIAAEASSSTAPPPPAQPPHPKPPALTPALDLTRYEAPSTPSLPAAATSATYLAARLANLQLLDRFGKHAWLLANHGLEAELAALERELAAVKREIDLVNIARRKRQEDVEAEMAALDEAWRAAVGTVLETEVAVEELKARAREELRRRAAAGQGRE